jgi:hypothetical protein
MGCDWCVSGVCRSGDEKTCDFKTLKLDKDSVNQRIEQEMDIIEAGLKKMKSCEDVKLLDATMKDVGDRIIGIKIMQEALQKMGFPYKSERNPFRLMILIKQVDKHMKKITKEARQNG